MIPVMNLVARHHSGSVALNVGIDSFHSGMTADVDLKTRSECFDNFHFRGRRGRVRVPLQSRR